MEDSRTGDVGQGATFEHRKCEPAERKLWVFWNPTTRWLPVTCEGIVKGSKVRVLRLVLTEKMISTATLI